MDSKSPKNITHHGKNIKRLRSFMGMNQNELAKKMNSNQNKISFIENSKELDDGTLEKVSQALGVPVDLIKKLDSEAFISQITNNTFTPQDRSQANAIGHLQNQENIYESGNVDKISELYERIIDLTQRITIQQLEIESLQDRLRQKENR